MSALFGFVGSGSDDNLQQMKACLSHRGQSAHVFSQSNGSIGIWSDTDTAVDQRKTVGIAKVDSGWIAMNGFQTPGESNSTCRLEVIANSLSEKGSLPPSLSGDFTIAFLTNDHHLYLARDGSGARTIYYGEHDGCFFFPTEPKGITSVTNFPTEIDPNSLAKYLTFSFVPGSPTMLRHVFELPAGHVLHREPSGQPQISRYFRFEDADSIAASSDSELVEQFNCKLSQSVSDRLSLVDDEPVVFLSGGLDSSVIAAELARQSRHRIRTFSLHFGEKYPNELSFAREVSNRIGSHHEEVYISPEVAVQNLRNMVWHLDDPIGDPITLPNFELANHVSDQTRFVFNGEGGDPCFGGPKNIPMMLTHWYGVEHEKGFREQTYLASYRRAYEELDHIFTPEFKAEIDLDELPKILTPFFECQRPKSLLDKLTAINIRLKGAHLILPKVERMLAASRVSPLSPLFSSEMVKFSFQIPSTMKLSRGVEKIIIKEAFKDQLPASVIQRPKSGMRVPVHFWFQGELRKYARHILSPKQIKKAGIFNPRRVKQLLNYDIEEGNGRYGLRLWMLITFEIWRRIVVEKESS